MWSWIHRKEKTRTEEIVRKNPAAGDIWLWVAVDTETKLVPTWCLDDRNLRTAKSFVSDLASRLSNRVQITTDGHRAYVDAVEHVFGSEIDFATLIKGYRFPMEPDTRYLPAQCIGCQVRTVTGDPDSPHISTSFVERQNWTVRTTNRRYTRLSNGFSRKLANHAASVALGYFAYHFIKIHRTLRRLPRWLLALLPGCEMWLIWCPHGESRSAKPQKSYDL